MCKVVVLPSKLLFFLNFSLQLRRRSVKSQLVFKTMERRPCWCTKTIVSGRELKSLFFRLLFQKLRIDAGLVSKNTLF